MRYSSLEKELHKINTNINSEEFQEEEFESSIKKILVRSAPVEKYLNSLISKNGLEKIRKDEYLDSNIFYVKKGMNQLDTGVADHILSELKTINKDFDSEIEKIYLKHSDLYPFANLWYWGENEQNIAYQKYQAYKNYRILISKIDLKLQQIEKIIKSAKTDVERDSAQILDFLSKEITFQDRKGLEGEKQKYWFLNIVNNRMARRKLIELDDAIDEYYSQNGGIYKRPKEYERYKKRSKLKIKEISTNQNVDKEYRSNLVRIINKQVRGDTKFRSKAGYSLIDSEVYKFKSVEDKIKLHITVGLKLISLIDVLNQSENHMILNSEARKLETVISKVQRIYDEEKKQKEKFDTNKLESLATEIEEVYDNAEQKLLTTNIQNTNYSAHKLSRYAKETKHNYANILGNLTDTYIATLSADKFENYLMKLFKDSKPELPNLIGEKVHFTEVKKEPKIILQKNKTTYQIIHPNYTQTIEVNPIVNLEGVHTIR